MLDGLNAEDVLDNAEAPSDEEMDSDENPELLAKLEQKKEQMVEDFLEIAYGAKHELVEQLKASFRGNKDISKTEQQQKIKDL